MTIDLRDYPKIINPVYRPYLFDKRFIKIFYGGAGSGKSYYVAQYITYLLLSEAGHNFLIIRKTDRTNRDSTFALICQVIYTYGFTDLFKINKTDMKITCIVNNNQAIFKGMDNPEKLKSMTFIKGILTDIWIEEASELSPKDYRHLRLRLRGRSKVPKQIILTFNPISIMSWLKAEFFDVKQPEDRVLILKTTYKDNEYLEEEDKLIIEEFKDQDYAYYRIYALGEWGIIGNLVFHNFVIEEFNYKEEDFDAVYPGMDFGTNHPFAIEMVGVKDGEVYIYNEMHRKGLTNADAIRLNEEMSVLDKSLYCIADSAEPDRIKEWKQYGYRVKPAKKGKGSVKFGLDYLRRKRVHIHKTKCPQIAAEWQAYKWREDKDGNVLDEPFAFKDDGIAAVRYALEPVWSRGRLRPSKSSARRLGL